MPREKKEWKKIRTEHTRTAGQLREVKHTHNGHPVRRKKLGYFK